jgi:hypothetical protein
MIRDSITDEMVDTAVKQTMGAIAQQAVKITLLAKVAITVVKKLAGELPIKNVTDTIINIVAPELEPLVDAYHRLEAYHARKRADTVQKLVITHKLPPDVVASLVLAPSPVYNIIQAALPGFVSRGIK